MRRALLGVCAWAVVACAPTRDDDPARVTDARLVAVVADPPEAAPGTAVSLAALVVSSRGTVADASVDWAFCHAQKPPSENDSVSPKCITDELPPEATGPTAVLRLPEDGCTLFGSETPPGDFRPRDADATGGYYQPLRAMFGGAASIALLRIACRPSNVPLESAIVLRDDYTANRNPTLVVESPPKHATLSEELQFSMKFGQKDAEPFVHLDPAKAVVWDRETLSVSFFATGGAFENARVVAEEPLSGPIATGVFRGPDVPGTVHFWGVARDSRGGSSFTRWDVVFDGQ